HLGGVFAEQGEVDAGAVPGCTEGVRPSGPYAHERFSLRVGNAGSRREFSAGLKKGKRRAAWWERGGSRQDAPGTGKASHTLAQPRGSRRSTRSSFAESMTGKA